RYSFILLDLALGVWCALCCAEPGFPVSSGSAWHFWPGNLLNSWTVNCIPGAVDCWTLACRPRLRTRSWCSSFFCGRREAKVLCSLQYIGQAQSSVFEAFLLSLPLASAVPGLYCLAVVSLRFRSVDSR